MRFSALAFGVHGAACGLFLLLAGLIWRDRRQNKSGLLGVAVLLGAAASSLNSVLEFEQAGVFWRAPILALAAGSPAVFWLWTRVVFDDDFVQRARHAVLWALLAAGELVNAYASDQWSRWGPVADTLVQLAALGLAALAAVQIMATWRNDLVMGRRRLRVVVLLGAVNIFRRIGFELDGNVIWNKGEIEGKRNYNQGNLSPYYQFPFNSWEHCILFRKPGMRSKSYSFPTVLNAKPVVKMVRGVNTLGHTAPFPPAIPDLLISQMRRGEIVLDPFSGSMTTGRSAHRQGLKSVSIELHEDYCQLGLRLLDEEDRENHDLFRYVS